MPNSVKQYIDSNYQYPAEYYINFVEVCDRMSKENGRIGMLVPGRSCSKTGQGHSERISLAGWVASISWPSLGMGSWIMRWLGTAGTVIRTGADPNSAGEFIRLHDLDAAAKESAFIRVLTNTHDGVKRRYTVNLSDFSKVPGNTICYSIPDEVRDLHDTLKKLDAEVADLDAESVGFARQGVATANDSRFLRNHWEVNDSERFKPIATGGSDASILPHVTEEVEWGTRSADQAIESDD